MKESKDILIKENDIGKMKECLRNTRKELQLLENEIQIIEHRKKIKGFKRFLDGIKKIVIRIDVKSGTNLLKLVLWIAMAGTIVFFSTDINSKIIGALTYFLGLAMDMLLLRKQLPTVGVTGRRLAVGISIIIFFTIMGILILGLMASAMEHPIGPWMSEFINISLFSCGFISTFLELVNSIVVDD